MISCVDQPSSATGTFTGNCIPDCDGKKCGDDGCGGSCGECDTFCQASGTCCTPSCEGKAIGDADGCGGCCPGCLGKECGDDGCGGSCGECSCGDDCDGGACIFHACDGKSCGDDGCGGVCGVCAGPQDSCVGGLCKCIPSCAGKNCGPNGCGGVCGECSGPQKQCVNGLCVCQPYCIDKVCGLDGCDGLCGKCECGETYVAGACIFQACDGKDCGPDGCGGSCGDCTEVQHACVDGQCVCMPFCFGKECGPDGCGDSCGECSCGKSCEAGICNFSGCDGLECGDDGCGGSCGTCDDPLVCVEGNCQPECTPQCINKACGDDSCGGVCGLCGCGETCINDQCVFDACVGMACGDDGCGGSCGSCLEGQMCLFGVCVCEPQCDGKNCGPDGCGGTCGSCGPGKACIDGQCPPPGMDCDDGNSIDWDGCTDGELSEFSIAEDLPTNKIDVATLDDGDFGVVWDDGGGGQTGDDLYFSWYNTQGSSILEVIKINQFDCDKSNNSLPAIAGGSSFFFTWRGYSGNSSCPTLGGGWTAIFVRLLGPGSAGELKIASTSYGGVYSPDAARLTNGNIATVWSQSGSVTSIFARLLGPDGGPIASQVTANTTQSGSYPHVVPLADGRFVVVWGPVGGSLLGQFFSASGGKEGSEFGFGSASEEPEIDSFSDDRMVITTYNYVPGGQNWNAYFQMYQANGFTDGPLVQFGIDLLEPQKTPDVATLDDGSFIVVWSETDDDGLGIWGQVFDGGGEPIQQAFQVNRGEPGNQVSPKVAAFSDGSFVVAWTSYGDAPHGILARRYSFDGTPIYH